MRLGFIGLGKMGRPMATNLLRAGYAVSVHNRSRAAVDELVAAGAVSADSPQAVAESSDVILTCLPDTAAVQQVYLGERGLIPWARQRQILVDHSTVAPSTSRALAKAAALAGAAFLDAPISGGPAGANSGTLTIMAGGAAADFAAVRPIFEVLGRNIHHVGPPGTGSVVKLVNQLLVAINMAGVVEALALGIKAGADPNVLLDVLGTSFGGSAMLTRAVPLIIHKQFTPGTPIRLILKDLGLIDELGQELAVRLLLGGLTSQIFTEAKALGLAELDMAALIQPLANLSGIDIA